MGKLLAFCGIDGSGKSTQIARLAAWARGIGLRTRVNRLIVSDDPFYSALEPIESSISRALFCELMTFQRYARIREIIPAQLAEFDLVICDRYLPCDEAYSFGYGCRSLEILGAVRDNVPRPDHTFLLDIAPELALVRIHRRNKHVNGRHENLEMLSNTRRAYLEHAHDWGAIVVDASRPIDESMSVILHRIGAPELRGNSLASAGRP